MSYRIGQIRRGNLSNQNNSIFSSVTLSPFELPCFNNFGGNPFQDYCLKNVNRTGEGENVQEQLRYFEKGETYYFCFGVAKVFMSYYQKYQNNTNLVIPNADQINITLYLKNLDEDDESLNPPQEIGTIRLGQKAINYYQLQRSLQEEIEYQVESFIFTPDKNYNTIVFRIQRNAYDVLESTNHIINSNTLEIYDGRRWLINDGLDTEEEERKLIITNDADPVTVPKNFNSSIVVFEGEVTTNESTYLCGCAKLTNIASSGVSGSNTLPWLKMGYQGRPGSLIVVNGEPIRIGSSGIYEVNNGISINSIMIPTLRGVEDIDAFLLDFAYEKED